MRSKPPILSAFPLFILLVAVIPFAVGCQPAGGDAPRDVPPAATDPPAAADVPASDPASSDPAEAAPDEEPATQPQATEEEAAAPAAANGNAESTTMPAIPLGLKPFDVPADNPITEEKIALGKMLYFDKRLSADDSISCATCHDPKMAWTEHRATSEGIHKQVGPRNSPTIINSAYAPVQFWDGRAASLEEQASGPMENPIEMGMTLDGVVEKLSKVPGYVEAFEKAYGTGVTKDGIVKAIATFERTVLSGNSRYDRYLHDEPDALNEQEKRGLELFHKNCGTCHTAPVFSNFSYVNAGVGSDKAEPDKGRMDVTGRERDMGKFRVPHLRDVEKTHPYFHDGSVESLEEAVAIMAAGGKENPNLSFTMKRVGEANLTEQDQADIVAFLKSLNGDFPVIEPPTLP